MLTSGPIPSPGIKVTRYFPFDRFSFEYAEVGALVTGIASRAAGDECNDLTAKLAGCTARRASGDNMISCQKTRRKKLKKKKDKEELEELEEEKVTILNWPAFFQIF